MTRAATRRAIRSNSRSTETGGGSHDFRRPRTSAPPARTIGPCRMPHPPRPPTFPADRVAVPAAPPRPSPARSPACPTANPQASRASSWTTRCAAESSAAPNARTSAAAYSLPAKCAARPRRRRCSGLENWNSRRDPVELISADGAGAHYIAEDCPSTKKERGADRVGTPRVNQLQ